MSQVTNYILIHSIIEEESGPDIFVQVERLNTLLGDRGSFMPVDRYSGGQKCFEAPVYLFAGNHFPIEMMLACFRQLTWECPDEVQLLYKGEYDRTFIVISA